MNSEYEIVRTLDGSDTVKLLDGDVTFHSTHGAVQESQHVFIDNGLSAMGEKDEISIFEMGFGTGLNALLAFVHATSLKQSIVYTAVESSPLPSSITSRLNYAELLDVSPAFFHSMHESKDSEFALSKGFHLIRSSKPLKAYVHLVKYDVIFYDAFGPGHAPNLWQADMLNPLYDHLLPGGCLVTFCAQGAFKRCLHSIGFEVEPLPGPPGKREMTRAWKR